MCYGHFEKHIQLFYLQFLFLNGMVKMIYNHLNIQLKIFELNNNELLRLGDLPAN